MASGSAVVAILNKEIKIQSEEEKPQHKRETFFDLSIDKRKK